MRKTLFFVILFFQGVLTFSQNIIIDKTPAWDDPNYTSIITSEGTDGLGVYAADSFILENETTLGELDVFGVNVNMPVDEVLSSINVFIYANINGIPGGNPSIEGSEIVGLTNITYDLFTYEELTIGQPVVNFLSIQLREANDGNQITLSPGKYWLCFFPTINGPGPSSTWLWTESQHINIDGSVPMIIDADSLLGIPDEWVTNNEAIGTNLTSLSFQIRDEVQLNVEDETEVSVTLYPNPASEIIYISNTTVNTINSIKIYSTLGNLLISKSENTPIDISNLSKGIYYVSIETSNGLKNTVKLLKS